MVVVCAIDACKGVGLFLTLKKQPPLYLLLRLYPIRLLEHLLVLGRVEHILVRSHSLVFFMPVVCLERDLLTVGRA